jgi:L-threonylcarbamoyladenylate synthase
MTRFISCASQDLNELGRGIRKGKTVIYPTDTVFGLGSNPFSEVGVRKCFAMKGRNETKPMPVLFCDFETVSRICSIDERTRILAQKFWPGGLTLVLPVKKRVKIPETLIGPRRTLGVRVPNHECCLGLIAASGGALIGTSANISGEPSFFEKNALLLAFAKDVDYFVDGECGKNKKPSTVVELEPNRLVFHREGVVSKAEILFHLEKASKTAFSAR